MQITISHDKNELYNRNENLIYQIVKLYFDEADSYKISYNIDDISIEDKDVIFVNSQRVGSTNFTEMIISITENDKIYLSNAPRYYPLSKYKTYNYKEIVLREILENIC